MHKDAAIIATHRRIALVVALLTAALIGCQEGITVNVVGIPADATVNVDSLNLGIARSPSKIYRYKGVGYARVLGVSPAPSYTVTARRLDGCIVAVGTTDDNGEDEVQIALKAVECKSPAPVPAPTPTPSADLARPDMSPASTDMAPAPAQDMAVPAPNDMAAPPAVCAPLAPLPATPIAPNLAPPPGSCTSPTRWTVDCQLHCPPVGAERIYVAYSWVLATDPLGYKMSRTFYATSTEKDVSNLSVGGVLEYGKCGNFSSYTYYNVTKQQLSSSTHAVTTSPLLCPGIKNGRLAPWESGPGAFFFYTVQ